MQDALEIENRDVIETSVDLHRIKDLCETQINVSMVYNARCIGKDRFN